MNTSGVQNLDKRQAVEVLLSPAKINLGLEITSRRSNGLHELQSLFLPLKWGDKMTIAQQGPHHHVHMHWHPTAPRQDALPLEKKNLLWPIFDYLDRCHPQVAPLQVGIEKHTPLGGGLGGGSSNAGTFLKYLVKKKILSPPEALDLAQKIGADVAFFTQGRPAWVEGVGEILSPCPLAPELAQRLMVFLAIPSFDSPTPEVFRHWANAFEDFRPRRPPLSHTLLGESEMKSYLQHCQNTLEPAAGALYPALHDILERLQASGPLYSGLSGTGSTCFALYFDAPLIKIKELQTSLRKDDCSGIYTQILD